MAETRLANVIVPEVFTDYTLEPSVFRNAFVESGIMAANPQINTLLDGGGLTFNVPFWQDLADSESEVPSETVAQTVNNITADDEVARRQFRTKAYGANALAAVQAGEDIMEAIGARVIAYWNREIQDILINSLTGVFADNVANDASDLVNDQSAVAFSDDLIIDTQQLLGDSGMGWAGIAVHSAIYSSMRKADLIDFVPVSEQPRPIPFYMGMRVIIDDRLPNALGVYDTYIFKAGALQLGVSSMNYEPTSLDRNEGTGFGIDELYTRRVLAIHPTGWEWLEGSVAGTSPTNAELALAANWSRVYEQKNAGVVLLQSLV